MKVAILSRERDPFSLRHYRENVVRELKGLGVTVFPFSEKETLPKSVDLYWDPRAAGGAPPFRGLLYAIAPFVVTVHGAAPFALPPWEIFTNWKSALRGKLSNVKKLYYWRVFRERVAAIITVSYYAKAEIVKYLYLDQDKIFPIYHGVDLEVFTMEGDRQKSNCAYFLHVSSYQPKKNVDRIIAAYISLQIANRPRLLIIAPGYRGDVNRPEGIEFILEGQSHTELAKWYRSAIGFMFPSLHETFGMPILEAMACGCPVITSNVTACLEVAGDAALLVNPRSVDEIANAMRRLMKDQELRKMLRKNGLKRVLQFTWRKSAKKHLEVFEKVLEGKYEP